MGDTCQPSTKQVYTFYSRNMISFKFFLLTVVALVPHHTVARPQDLFQTISGLTQELINIAAAQAFQSQFEVPGLRIRPSDSSSETGTSTLYRMAAAVLLRLHLEDQARLCSVVLLYLLYLLYLPNRGVSSSYSVSAFSPNGPVSVS